MEYPKVISFNKTDEEYGWLSNMHASRVRYKGETWLTAEHLFQYMRFEGMEPVDFTNKEGKTYTVTEDVIKHEILETFSPLFAKKVAAKITRSIIKANIKHENPEHLAAAFDRVLDKTNDHYTIADQLEEGHYTEAELGAIAIASVQLAKEIGRRYRTLRKSSKANDLRLMNKVVRLKLAYTPDLIRRLIASGDAQIVEDVTRRANDSGKFWGMALQDDGSWLGENNLGKIWMQAREDLRQVLFV